MTESMITLEFSIRECEAIMYLLHEKLIKTEDVPYEVNIFAMYDYIADELPFQRNRPKSPTVINIWDKIIDDLDKQGE